MKFIKAKGPHKGGDFKQTKQKGNNKKTPKQKKWRTSILGRNSPLGKAKERKNDIDKTYHWCKWHKAWVEHEPEVRDPTEEDSARSPKKSRNIKAGILPGTIYGNYLFFITKK